MPVHQPHFLAIPGLNCCRVLISPYHQVSYGASAILADPSSVLYPLMQRRYNNVLDRRLHSTQQGLWLVVTGNSIGKARKRVVRNWARRRFEHAFAEQLKLRGYDKNGRRLNDPPARGSLARGPRSYQGRPPATTDSTNLCGTVSVQLVEKILETKYAEMQNQVGLVVDEVLRRLR